MKILFTSVGRRVELVQAFREAAKNLDVDLQIIGADISLTAPALYYCDSIIQVPRITDSAYIPFLASYCSSNEVKVLIPTIDTDLLLLAKNRRQFKKTVVLVSDEDKISLCRDKRLTGAFFQKSGVKYPIPYDDYENYDLGFPAFIKPKDGSSSINAFKVNNKMELETFASIVPEYIVQQYISGTEYTVDAFCDFDGNPLLITPRIRLAVRSGEVLKTQICMDTKIIDETKSIIEKFKPRGPITIQLIRDSNTGEDYYIEINPRFGGGAPLSMKSGAKSNELLLRLIQGEKLEYDSDAAEDGAIYCRFDQSIKVK